MSALFSHFIFYFLAICKQFDAQERAGGVDSQTYFSCITLSLIFTVCGHRVARCWGWFLDPDEFDGHDAEHAAGCPESRSVFRYTLNRIQEHMWSRKRSLWPEKQMTLGLQIHSFVHFCSAVGESKLGNPFSTVAGTSRKLGPAFFSGGAGNHR